ncbi:MAG: heavy metal-responsive transcriptional regulator [Acidobacteria bacterium]|nr:heavy metal-responsive transcriptional regulator [Acidobacteriota bacterium]
MVAPAKNSYLRAGELARAVGVSPDTLHHYERKGVLAPPRRSANGYREYPADALERVRLVRRALAIGFTLDELAQILRARDRGVAPCREVRALAAAKLAEFEERLRALVAVREELRAVTEEWGARLARTPKGTRAGLLESLAASRRSNETRAHAPAWRRKKGKKGTKGKKERTKDGVEAD